MPIIKAAGLLEGERIASLSDTAKMYWPFLYSASNGYGRFEIDYLSIITKAFGNFDQKPSEECISSLLKEYRDKHLLFLYKAGGRLWGAWDDASSQQYFNAKDKASPAPPEPAFQQWKAAYRQKKADASRRLTALEIALACEDIASCEEVDNEKHGFQYEKPDTSITNLHNTTPTSASTHKTSTPENTNTANACLPESLPVGVEGWDRLCQLAGKARMSFDPSPFSDLCTKVWCWYNMAEKMRRIEGIEARIEAGQYGPDVDPQFVPTLENFCRKKVDESIRPRSSQLQVVGRKDVMAEARAALKAQSENRRAS